MDKKIAALLLVFAGSFAVLYHHVIVKLVHDWYTDENYSHGFLIVPIALFFFVGTQGKAEGSRDQI
jgi:hypothetical protein